MSNFPLFAELNALRIFHFHLHKISFYVDYCLIYVSMQCVCKKKIKITKLLIPEIVYFFYIQTTKWKWEGKEIFFFSGVVGSNILFGIFCVQTYSHTEIISLCVSLRHRKFIGNSQTCKKKKNKNRNEKLVDDEYRRMKRGSLCCLRKLQQITFSRCFHGWFN